MMHTGNNYVPSPILFEYDTSYSALANSSGRMQYYREEPDGSRIRIGRNEFVNAYNSKPVVAIKPIPTQSAQVFQLQFFIKE